jgi:hypothetical protein
VGGGGAGEPEPDQLLVVEVLVLSVAARVQPLLRASVKVKAGEFSEVGGQGKGNVTIIDTVDLVDISTTPC